MYSCHIKMWHYNFKNKVKFFSEYRLLFLIVSSWRRKRRFLENHPSCSLIEFSFFRYLKGYHPLNNLKKRGFRNRRYKIQCLIHNIKVKLFSIGTFLTNWINWQWVRQKLNNTQLNGYQQLQYPSHSFAEDASVDYKRDIYYQYLEQEVHKVI